MIVIDREYAPVFTNDMIPCSYWHARCEYAGYHNAIDQFVLRRHVESAYHADCYCIVLMNEARQNGVKCSYEDAVRATFDKTGQNCTQLDRFEDEAGKRWLTSCTRIPPWCQYCMQMF